MGLISSTSISSGSDPWGMKNYFSLNLLNSSPLLLQSDYKTDEMEGIVSLGLVFFISLQVYFRL